MQNNTQSVAKAEWGKSRKEFVCCLPKILEKMNSGATRKETWSSLDLNMSYRVFCIHYKNIKNFNLPTFSSTSPVSPPHQSEQPTKVVQAGAASGGFSLPTLDIGENE